MTNGTMRFPFPAAAVSGRITGKEKIAEEFIIGAVMGEKPEEE